MKAKHNLQLERSFHTILSFITHPNSPSTALPDGISLNLIYSDFLGYIMTHTRKFFHEHVLDGKNVWDKYASSMHIAFAHPNGWGTPERAFLRNAAVSAGYLLAQDASSRIQFVTEAEASVHYCLKCSGLDQVLIVSHPYINARAKIQSQ